MTEPESRLARRLGLFDAVVVGLGSMVGAGIFVAIGPAAGVAGSGLLLSLALAGFVAFCNATSAAQLAALYPQSGGTYVYGRERLGAFWGFMAGWGFVVSKVAGCAVIALALGIYAAPGYARWLGAAAVAALTAVNVLGVRQTALLTRAMVAVVLACLTVVVLALWVGGSPSTSNLGPVRSVGPVALLRAAGMLFFAFAGYARIATMGEEVRDPARTIPRAIPAALTLTLVLYAAVAISALLAVGPGVLSSSAAPLETAVLAGSLPGLAAAARLGGVVATLGVLISLLAGVSRTTFAMAADGYLPRSLSAVHPRRRTPYRAEVAVGGAVCALVLTVDLTGALTFSAFTLLAYYGVANSSAATLRGPERTRAGWIPYAGVVGCASLALALPAAGGAVAGAVLLVGAAWWRIRAHSAGS